MAERAVDIGRLDVLQAQINVSISHARELVASWLPPPPAPSEAQHLQPHNQPTLDEDNDLFKPGPPRLGLGAPVPKHFYDEGSKLRKDISSTDLLHRRLLGSKRSASHISDKHQQRLSSKNQRSAPRGESESEEEVGRSALGKSKRQKGSHMKPLEVAVADRELQKDDVNVNPIEDTIAGTDKPVQAEPTSEPQDPRTYNTTHVQAKPGKKRKKNKGNHDKQLQDSK
ncbi:hypothetical protein BDZ91DRAFT_845662 [Kalaharituber pfeilii]|nr:hypothetical protein BDZ91DRAFT_845662 [Kalaharituber pfeilii]